MVNVTTKHTATVQVVIPQLVHCRHCGCKFVYEMTVRGIGCATSDLFSSAATAKAAAEEEAQQSLEAALRDRSKLCAAVPCRNCHKYQPYMHQLVGEQQYSGLGCIGFPLLIFGPVVSVAATIGWFFLPEMRPLAVKVGVGGLVACLIGHLVLQRMEQLAVRYDPNKVNLSERMARATEQTMTPEDYDDKQAIRVRYAYNQHVKVSKPDPWKKAEATHEPLVVDWWAVPSIFMDGGKITFRINDDDDVEVVVPEDAEPGRVFDITTKSDRVLPFQVRILAINTHPDEQRLE